MHNVCMDHLFSAHTLNQFLYVSEVQFCLPFPALVFNSLTLSAEWDSDMASLLVLLHLLTPQPAGRKRPKKMSVGEAIDHLVKFHKVCQDNVI